MPEFLAGLGPILGPAAGLGILGLLKGEFIDKPEERKQHKLRAEELRVSPWMGTGVVRDRVATVNPLETALGAGLQGAAFGAANSGKLSGLFHGSMGQAEGDAIAKAASMQSAPSVVLSGGGLLQSPSLGNFSLGNPAEQFSLFPRSRY